MSAVTGSRGSALNSSHVHRTVRPPGPWRVKSHVWIETRGVGPAESTGKSRVSYWPGGSRSAVAPDRGRPRNPRENGDVVMEPPGNCHGDTENNGGCTESANGVREQRLSSTAHDQSSQS